MIDVGFFLAAMAAMVVVAMIIVFLIILFIALVLVIVDYVLGRNQGPDDDPPPRYELIPELREAPT